MRQFENIKKLEGETAAVQAREDAARQGKLLVKDIITDAAFEQTLTHPRDFDVLATTNLNGDYLSDALAAQVGGIGMAPGANINFPDSWLSHYIPSPDRYPLVYWVQMFYTILIPLVIGAMALFVLTDIYRIIRTRGKKNTPPPTENTTGTA